MAHSASQRFPGGTRLRRARDARGWSVTRLAHQADVAERSIRQYESGRADPGSTTLAALASALRVRAEWIVLGAGPMELDSRDTWRHATVAVAARSRDAEMQDTDAAAVRELDERPEEFYVLPLLRGVAACGPGHVVGDDDIEGPAIIHKNWCPHPEQTDYIRCQGLSMEPAIPDGAMVTIDRAESDPDRLVGYVVAVWLAEQEAVTIKRLARNSRGGFVAMPDNPTADVLSVELGPNDRVIGRVRTVHAELGRL